MNLHSKKFQNDFIHFYILCNNILNILISDKQLNFSLLFFNKIIPYQNNYKLSNFLQKQNKISSTNCFENTVTLYNLHNLIFIFFFFDFISKKKIIKGHTITNNSHLLINFYENIIFDEINNSLFNNTHN